MWWLNLRNTTSGEKLSCSFWTFYKWQKSIIIKVHIILRHLKWNNLHGACPKFFFLIRSSKVYSQVSNHYVAAVSLHEKYCFSLALFSIFCWSSFFIRTSILCYSFFSGGSGSWFIRYHFPLHHFLSLCIHPFIQEPQRQSESSIRSSSRTIIWKSDRLITGRRRWWCEWGWPFLSLSAW